MTDKFPHQAFRCTPLSMPTHKRQPIYFFQNFSLISYVSDLSNSRHDEQVSHWLVEGVM